MVRNNSRAIVIAFIISWLAAAIFAFLFISVRNQNTKFSNMYFLAQQKIDSFKDITADYERLKQKSSQWEKESLDYVQWQFALKEEIAMSEVRILNELNKIKDLKKNNELASALYNNLGLAYTTAFDFNSAIKAFEEAIALKPNDQSAYYCLGMLYSTFRSDKARAIKNYQKFVDLAPKSPKADDVKERIKALKK